MKSHDFAQILLNMPNLEIYTPPVKEYDDDLEAVCPTPTAEIVDGAGPDDAPMKAVCISYKR